MKKTIFCAIALFCVVAVSAQVTEEDMQASKQRSEKLADLTQPKDCGIAELDKLTATSASLATETLDVVPQLQNLYSRALGETGEDITQAEVRAALREELAAIGERVTKQAAEVASATLRIPDAGDALAKERNPLKLKGATKTMNYIKDVLNILKDESTFQVKTVAELVKATAAAIVE